MVSMTGVTSQMSLGDEESESIDSENFHLYFEKFYQCFEKDYIFILPFLKPIGLVDDVDDGCCEAPTLWF